MIKVTHAPVGGTGVSNKPWFSVKVRTLAVEFRLARDSNGVRPYAEGNTYFSMSRDDVLIGYTSLSPEEVEELITALQLIQEGNRQEKDLI